MQRDSTIIYRSFYEAIDALPKDEQADAYKALFEYSLNKNEIKLTGMAAVIFGLMKPNIDANLKRWENGNKPKQKQKGSKTEAKDKQTISKTEANKDKDKDVNKDNNTNKDENEKTAETKTENLPALTSDRLQDHRPAETKDSEQTAIPPGSITNRAIKPANELLAQLLADKPKMDGMYINLRVRFPKESKEKLVSALPLLIESCTVRFGNNNPNGSNYNHYCTALSKWLSETKYLPEVGGTETGKSKFSFI